MASNFIKITSGDGRCGVCDFSYSLEQTDEVREHSEHHDRYLTACDGVGAPVHRADRTQMMAAGAELLELGTTLTERVKGAERQVEALFHEHLAAVLLGHVTRRLSFTEFVTFLDRSGRLDGRYEQEIAHELRQRYSARPRC